MSITFRAKDAEELKKYMAIPYGLIKLLVGTIITLALTAGVVFCGLSLTHFFEVEIVTLVSSTTRNLATIISIFGTVIIGMIVLCLALSDTRREWISDYFVRNVRGYTAWLYIDEKTKMAWCYEIVENRPENKNPPLDRFNNPLGGILVGIHLGGWRKIVGNGIRQLTSRDAMLTCPLHDWTARLHSIIDGMICIELQKFSAFYDRSERVFLEARNSILFLERVQKPNNGMASISDSLVHLMREKTRLEEKIRALDLLYICAETNLKTIESQIKRSDRLQFTIEGLILLLTAHEALEILSRTDENQAVHNLWKDELEKTRKTLEEMRKRARYHKKRG